MPTTKQPSGAGTGAALAGRKIVVDVQKMLDLLQQMQKAGIHYQLGAKQKMSTPIGSFAPKAIDCSGFVRYVLYNGSGGSVHIPDGTWAQNKYFNDTLFTQVDYQTASLADSRLRIAFANQAEGHVWLIHDAKTIESHSLHKGEGNGPDRRAWNDIYLLPIVAHCYLLT